MDGLVLGRSHRSFCGPRQSFLRREREMPIVDLIIGNGTVADGTGGPLTGGFCWK